MENKITLNGQWSLRLINNCDLDKNNYINSANQIQIDAKVPGNFELDLYAAGLEPDPIWGNNNWEYFKYETYHLFYTRKFKANPSLKYELCFEGIDTVADIILNGKIIKHVANMFIAHTVEVEGLLEENELTVHIYPAMLEGRKDEYTMRSWNGNYRANARYIRKAAHTFGWDIMPRAVSGGLFRDCYLIEKKPARIKDVCYFANHVDPSKGTGDVSFVFNTEIEEDSLRGYEMEISGVCGDSSFSRSHDLWGPSGLIFMIPLENCKYWYPKNYGEPNLYTVEAKLKKNGEVLDVYTFKMGIRKVELIRTSVMEKDGSGEFKFRINGQDIFVLGTNWVPVDAYHSKDAERLPKILEALDEIGCNCVRCWGGNIYEDHAFFDFCDEHGIIVWQDFSMACGLYPTDERFCEQMREEATFIVKKLRNHPSLCLWAGDNECDLLSCWVGSSPEASTVTREVLKKVVENYDFPTPYLPSSPYIDTIAFNNERPPTEIHSWGGRDWFKGEFYTEVESRFESEIGYQASPSPASLRKCSAEEYLFPWIDEEASKKYGQPIGNVHQCAHAPEMEQKPNEHSFILPLTDKHIRNLFGRYAENIDEYCRMSQISQAEAFKYFIERFRVRKPNKTGIIWWNLFDGHPVHSNAVLDYYFVKKLGFHFIKRSQNPCLMMFDEPRYGSMNLVAVNDTQKRCDITYRVLDVMKDTVVTEGKASVEANANLVVEKIAEIKEKTMLLIEYEINGEKFSNHFTCNMPTIDLEEYLTALKKCKFDNFEGF